MTTLQVLKDARALIFNGWTRNSYYRMVFGRHTYCAMGAINKAACLDARSYVGHWEAEVTLKNILEYRGLNRSVTKFNDDATSKQEVLDLFDEAIARLEQV